MAKSEEGKYFFYPSWIDADFISLSEQKDFEIGPKTQSEAASSSP